MALFISVYFGPLFCIYQQYALRLAFADANEKIDKIRARVLERCEPSAFRSLHMFTLAKLTNPSVITYQLI